MEMGQSPEPTGAGGLNRAGKSLANYEADRLVKTFEDFADPSQEWRRLFSELLGTFFLVLVAAGGGMIGQAFPNTISRSAAVVAPGLMVLAIILFMGKVSGAHLNPAVSIAFALRGDFPWLRVPGYVAVQLAGAALAAWFLKAVVHVSATYGSNYPATGYSAWDAFLMEAVLTLGLVSVILGTASGAQNLGVVGAFGVGAYIALAGLWGSPISGASMNPSRTFGPDLLGRDFSEYWPSRRSGPRGRLRLRPSGARRRSCRFRRGPGCAVHGDPETRGRLTSACKGLAVSTVGC
jgi:aquaporin Z